MYLLRSSKFNGVTNPAPAQKYSFKAPCMTRGGTGPVLRILPTSELVIEFRGFAKLGVLNALNISQRNCSRYRSSQRQFLPMPRSQLSCRGPRNTARGVLPKEPGRLGWNAAMLKYWFSQSFLLPRLDHNS